MPETINNYHRKNEKLQFVKSLITDKIFMLKCFFEVAVSRDFLAFYFLFYESNLNGPLINSAVLACEESLISRISSRKRNFQQNHFSLWVSFIEKMPKNLVTLPL